MKEIDPIIIKLLKNRGVEGETAIEEFLSDKPKMTYDPLLLKNMKAGVDLIMSAIEKGRQICIYGDYDADGITSICLLKQVLGHLTEKLEYYIPSRFEEGYGLNKDALDTIKARGAELVVTVDCGSVSYDEVEHAKEIGLDIMVTDHHSITDTIADCIVINPKQPGCGYPFKDLAGCGVAFKLAQALQKKSGLDKSVLNEVLDLAALGTIGDIVPLVGENRTIAKYGMRKINNCVRPGLRALIEGTSLKMGSISSDNIAYVLVPHLNAAGRMLDASIAVELLSSAERAVVSDAVATLISNNKQRKKIQEDTYEMCMELADVQCREDNFALINCPDAHEGIAGIVAGKIKDKLYKPTVIVTPSGADGEFLKGTGRSVEGVNLYLLLKSCEDLFERFGGHAGACGFLLKKEYFEELKTRLNRELDGMLAGEPGLLERKSSSDIVLEGAQLSFELVRCLEALAPFGNKNEKPVLELEWVTAENPVFMGDRGQHVRFTARCRDGTPLGCVMFGNAEECRELLTSGASFAVLGNGEIQEWNGRYKLQFVVAEIKKVAEA